MYKNNSIRHGDVNIAYDDWNTKWFMMYRYQLYKYYILYCFIPIVVGYVL